MSYVIIQGDHYWNEVLRKWETEDIMGTWYDNRREAQEGLDAVFDLYKGVFGPNLPYIATVTEVFATKVAKSS